MARTPDLQIRSLPLYPSELQARWLECTTFSVPCKKPGVNGAGLIRRRADLEVGRCRAKARLYLPNLDSAELTQELAGFQTSDFLPSPLTLHPSPFILCFMSLPDAFLGEDDSCLGRA